MKFLRKYLLWLRKEFYNDKFFFSIKILSVAFVLGAANFFTDRYLPTGSWWNVIRTVELIPTAIAIFNILYLITVLSSINRLQNDESYIPIRMRFSYSWRLRIAAMIGALLLVLIFATNEGPAYTFSSSIIGAFIIAVVAFIRPTKEELQRSQLGIPDLRDIRFEMDQEELKKRKQKKKDDSKSNTKKTKLVRF